MSKRSEFNANASTSLGSGQLALDQSSAATTTGNLSASQQGLALVAGHSVVRIQLSDSQATAIPYTGTTIVAQIVSKCRVKHQKLWPAQPPASAAAASALLAQPHPQQTNADAPSATLIVRDGLSSRVLHICSHSELISDVLARFSAEQPVASQNAANIAGSQSATGSMLTSPRNANAGTNAASNFKLCYAQNYAPRAEPPTQPQLRSTPPVSLASSPSTHSLHSATSLQTAATATATAALSTTNAAPLAASFAPSLAMPQLSSAAAVAVAAPGKPASHHHRAASAQVHHVAPPPARNATLEHSPALGPYKLFAGQSPTLRAAVAANPRQPPQATPSHKPVSAPLALPYTSEELNIVQLHGWLFKRGKSKESEYKLRYFVLVHRATSVDAAAMQQQQTQSRHPAAINPNHSSAKLYYYRQRQDAHIESIPPSTAAAAKSLDARPIMVLHDTSSPHCGVAELHQAYAAPVVEHTIGAYKSQHSTMHFATMTHDGNVLLSAQAPSSKSKLAGAVHSGVAPSSLHKGASGKGLLSRTPPTGSSGQQSDFADLQLKSASNASTAAANPPALTHSDRISLPSQHFGLTLTTPARVFWLLARSSSEQRRWCRHMNRLAHAAQEIQKDNAELDDIAHRQFMEYEYARARHDSHRLMSCCTNLHSALQDSYCINWLLAWLQQRHCEEQLLFWLDCAEFKLLCAQEQHNLTHKHAAASPGQRQSIQRRILVNSAQHIVQQYITQGAPYEIALSPTQRDEMQQRVQSFVTQSHSANSILAIITTTQFAASLFDSAWSEVAAHLQQQSWPEFVTRSVDFTHALMRHSLHCVDDSLQNVDSLSVQQEYDAVNQTPTAACIAASPCVASGTRLSIKLKVFLAENRYVAQCEAQVATQLQALAMPVQPMNASRTPILSPAMPAMQRSRHRPNVASPMMSPAFQSPLPSNELTPLVPPVSLRDYEKTLRSRESSSSSGSSSSSDSSSDLGSDPESDDSVTSSPGASAPRLRSPAMLDQTPLIAQDSAGPPSTSGLPSMSLQPDAAPPAAGAGRVARTAARQSHLTAVRKLLRSPKRHRALRDEQQDREHIQQLQQQQNILQQGARHLTTNQSHHHVTHGRSSTVGASDAADRNSPSRSIHETDSEQFQSSQSPSALSMLQEQQQARQRSSHIQSRLTPTQDLLSAIKSSPRHRPHSDTSIPPSHHPEQPHSHPSQNEPPEESGDSTHDTADSSNAPPSLAQSAVNRP